MLRDQFPKTKQKIDGWFCSYARFPKGNGIYEVWFQGYKFHTSYNDSRWHDERIGFFSPRFWRKLDGKNTNQDSQQQDSGSSVC